ncbi:mitochondrial large ribosomal subunit [Metarhizium rileyi]|uniref:54S ribosomal protein L22, mitochondrial n=1 Tax=Metarhizium rileyi (strain RCEF 4871) TaxID=1649241 RepID=A0A166WSS1_METRR|nr:mitochondrial large ribosomal subunit [Metarhizium rileyi RCEF 4871]TWU71685.1 54S ribosomal protein L22, mitochondrial [Metarhizium rileyi]
MSLRLAGRRLAISGTPSPVRPNSCSLSTTQIRTKWSVNIFKGWGKSGARDSPSSRTPQDATSELDDPKKRAAFLERNMHGSVSDNIFQDEIDAAKPSSAQDAPSLQQQEQKTRENMAMVTDPDPRSRIRWQRKKVIQMVRSNGAVSREDRIKATERQLLHRSHFMPTSLKKLVMLSRQIAGKPVDEAISQMQWSKKKMAAEVKYYLEEARDLAIAQRGMGLGKVNGEVFDKPRKILTRDGKWIQVEDPTRMYVAQSWVGRGPWRGKEIDYKGRGRMGVIKHPSTSFTVLLKEEKTRIREYEELEAKKTAKGPWVHLPNRRVHGQRPYYSW